MSIKLYPKQGYIEGSAVDITESKRLYKELIDKTRELESFVYTVSHDLKAPLVTIEGFSSILLQKYRDKLDDEGSRYLERIQYNTEYMEKLIHNLLKLSRIGRVIGEKEIVDIEKIVNKIKEDLKFRLDQDKINLSIETPLPKAFGDEDSIKQVFENLIRNAIQFIGQPQKPKIKVGIDSIKDSYIQYYVKDNGIGISRKYHEKIFEIFQRLNDIKSEGPGVGLAIVKKIIEHHGGRVWLNSRKGNGSAFHFTLPKKEI